MSEIQVKLIEEGDEDNEEYAEDSGGGGITFEIEEGTEFILDDNSNREGEGVQVLDLEDPNVSQEVEVVTIEATTEQQHQHGRFMSYNSSPSKNTKRETSSTLHSHSRIKSAPALLRNSRRFQNHSEQYLSFSGGAASDTVAENSTGASVLPPASASFMGTKSRGHHQSGSPGQGPSSTVTSQSNLQHAVLLDEHGQPTDEFVVLATNEAGEYTIVDRGSTSATASRGNGNNASNLEMLNASEDPERVNEEDLPGGHSGQTIIICQDPETQQFQQMIEDEDGNYVPIETSLQYHIDDGTIFFDDSGNAFDTSSANIVVVDSAGKNQKPRSNKKSKKPLQVVIGPDGKPVKKKGQTELPCMEKGCMMTCFNVNELRKHLNVSHGLTFDEEIIQFLSDDEFKRWRETYERERMVSFIYRGGTKKISKDQSVTYMICHRSGHYKPTMPSETKRQRKMKPQGSCKMGGYCTAGIKLIKNLESGGIRMDICHTHYGHPLDSHAIPHLRVNPTLRKLILGKFKAGLTFTEVLAYIHHNPDRLEGLRLVDRRAVRNIFDSWKNPLKRSKQAQKDIDELPLFEMETLKSPEKSKSSDHPEETITAELSASDKEDDTMEDLTKLPEDNKKQKQKRLQTKIVADPEKEERPPVLHPVKMMSPMPLSRKPGLKRKQEESPSATKEDDNRKGGNKRSRRSEKVAPSESPSNSSPTVNTRSYGLRPNRKVEVYNNKSPPKKPIAPEQKPQKIVPTKSKPPKKKIVEEVDPLANSEAEEESSPPMIISETLAVGIEKLNKHCDSGPTVLLYKPIGNSVKYGETRVRDFRKEDFCVVLQSPVQRQLLQMFPDIISFEVLDGPKSSESALKLSFLMVLDEYREAIPVAWLVTNANEPRMFSNFFKAILRECGELPAKYFMSARTSDFFRLWCSTFETKPLPLQNDIEVKRELKSLVWQEFSTDKGRREVWELMESLIYERHPENLDISSLEEKFEPLLDKLPHSGEFIEKLERDWLSRVEEWAYCHRFGLAVNVMGSSHSFSRLKKFVSFKGTKNLHSSFEHILKIGYDKCFLRSKRMFKGDQKHSAFLEEIKRRHVKSRSLTTTATLAETPSTAPGAEESSWMVCISEKVNHAVSYVNSPCNCKLLCSTCKICIHMYICNCSDFINNQAMCEHIHFTHCNRMSITEEGEFITGDPIDGEGVDGAFGKIETDGTEENPVGSVINIEAVLKAAGLFHRSDGLQPDQIISITDADTQRILYEHQPIAATTNNQRSKSVTNEDEDEPVPVLVEESNNEDFEEEQEENGESVCIASTDLEEIDTELEVVVEHESKPIISTI